MTCGDIALMDKETILEPSTLKEILGEKENFEKQRMIIALKDRAKELKISIKIIDDLISALKKDIQQSNIEKELPTSGFTSFEHPEIGNLKCDIWQTEGGYIWKYGKDGNKIIACYSILYPLERLIDVDTGMEKLTIRYEHNGKLYDRTFDKQTLASDRKILKLADYGLSVTAQNAKHIVEYISTLENLNPIPTKKSSLKMGWIKDDKEMLFIPYCDDRIKFDTQNAPQNIHDMVCESGDIEAYIKLISKIRKSGKAEPQILLSTALSSVLIKPLKLQPFILNLWGQTGTGKSLSLMYAASVWGNPNEGGYILESDSTKNFLVAIASMLNNLPLCIDDFAKVTSKFNSNQEIVYSLCAGKEKGRLNSDTTIKNLRSWRNAIITTNENPLAQENMRGGALNRIIDINLNSKVIFDNPDELLSVLSENYGFLGEIFIEYVLKLGFEKIADIQKGYKREIEKIVADDEEEKASKQIIPLSVILTADRILTDGLFRDKKYLDIRALIGQLKNVSEISDGQRAYEDIKDIVIGNPNKFVNLDSVHLDSGFYEVWGYLKDGYVYFIPKKLRELLSDSGYDVKSFINWGKENKLMKMTKKNQCNLRLGGNVISTYAIKIIDATPEDFRSVSEEDIKENPFSE